MADLKSLTSTRKFARKLVTEIHNELQSGESMSHMQRERLKMKLDDKKQELVKLNSDIQELSEFDDSSQENEHRKNEEYFDKIRDCYIVLNSRVSHVETPHNNEPNRSVLRGPVAPLPKYSGSYSEDFSRFISEFEETVSKYGYPQYDKYLLLKQQLSGRALILINSLGTDDRGYEQARNLLQEAFESPHLKKANLIKQLINLKLNDRSDPFEYISQVKLITERINKIPVTCKDIVRYFVWHGLTDKFRSLLISITNETSPSLDNIMNNFFDACERYDHSKGVKSAISKEVVLDSNQFAVNVTPSIPNYRPCSVCTKVTGKDADHPTFKCSIYPDAKQKVAIIEKFKGCIKCGGFSHATNVCRYRFKSRCNNCSAWHFTFLCSGGKKPNSYKDSHNTQSHSTFNKKNDKGSTDTINITQNLQSISEGVSLLPTFTCKVNDKTIRCLKDDGSQLNFIDSNLVKTLNLERVKDVKISVNGINGPKNYLTSVVEIPLMIGSKQYMVTAVCLPSIDINW